MELSRTHTKAKGARSSAASNVDWRDVASQLRQDIEQGKFTAGARIPTEPELMREFGVSRYAVRRALNSLQTNGLVRIEQGRGTFVHDGYLVSYKLGDRQRFTDVLLENQITPAQEILRIERVAAQEHVAAALNILVGEPVIHMISLGYADGQVVKQDVNYLPLPRFDGAETALRSTRSVTDALASLGVADYRRQSTSIVGRLPNPAEARMLRQLPSQPVFEILRLDVDEGDQPVLYGVTLFSCERVRLVLERDPAAHG